MNEIAQFVHEKGSEITVWRSPSEGACSWLHPPPLQRKALSEGEAWLSHFIKHAHSELTEQGDLLEKQNRKMSNKMAHKKTNSENIRHALHPNMKTSH